MPLILNIDTATAGASVSLASEGTLLEVRMNTQPVDHAAWIHTAIEKLMQAGNKRLKDLTAIAVVAGPGSYTGLRVGMATAKGICYALNVPLISINTLRAMAYATKKDISSSLLVCPMLDARRMEVFTALYDTALHELLAPCAMILEENSFADWLNSHTIVFSGNGSGKWKELVRHENAIFKDVFYSPQDIAGISYDQFMRGVFSDMAYIEPVYLKEFYSYQKK